MRAIDVANWFIDKANSELVDEEIVEGISNMKLQKLLYFAQAAKLSVDKKPLFEDEIEAWEYGPVVKDVYHKFKKYENQPISKPSNRDFRNLDESTMEFLENIWDIFGKFSAARLVHIAHNHEPWKEAYKSRDKIITKKTLRSYYEDTFQKV